MRYCNIAFESDLHKGLIKQSGDHCVFISHKKEDEDAALAIGNFLTEIVGVHIYLDIIDGALQKATQIENDVMIVNSIKKGLEYSTHLLCLISDKTQLSWWVPYEIGIADSKNISICSLKLINTEDVPSFLRIHPCYYNVEDFLKYAISYTKYGKFFYEREYPRLLSNADMLNKYIDT